MPYQWHRIYENGNTIILPEHMQIIRTLSNIHNEAVNKRMTDNSRNEYKKQQQKKDNPRYSGLGSVYTTSSGEKAQVIF